MPNNSSGDLNKDDEDDDDEDERSFDENIDSERVKAFNVSSLLDIKNNPKLK